MASVVEIAAEPECPDGFEMIDGRLVEPRPMSALASGVASRVIFQLGKFCETHACGQPLMDMFFPIPLREDPRRIRKPDFAYVSYERWPADRIWPYRGNPLPVVPDLVGEVASPNDEAEDLVSKALQYLRAGVRLVWVVYPNSKTIHAYTSATSIRAFVETDELDGGEVLPGFRVPMAKLFPPMETVIFEDDK